MQKSIGVGVFLACVSVALASFAGNSGDDIQWKRVERMDPGTKIAISVDGAAPVERYFVELGESEIVVLNLAAPDLPKRRLLNMAKDNPAWMAGTATTIYKDNAVRVGPEGVFVKDRRVAALADVVEHIPRAKVTALK